MKVYKSWLPFSDPSGIRLREWMGVTEDEFYDLTRIAIVPMAFCFPGYDSKGSDLPPPPICAKTWREPVMGYLSHLQLTLAVGSAAIRWHLGPGKVSDVVSNWRQYLEAGVIPLPHPSWRNTAWLKRNPWFESELLPVLRHKVRENLEAK